MRARWLLAIAVLGLSFATAYWFGVAAREPKQQQPTFAVIEGLAVAVADLDMGEVWEEKGVFWRLPIRNQTSARIEIRDFAASCGCIAIEPRALSIPAAQTVTIDLKFDLTHRLYSDSGLSHRPFVVTIQPIFASGGKRSPGWQLHGTVKSRVTLDTSAVHFGEQPIQGQPPVTRKILATVHVPSQRLEVTVNPEVATVAVNRRKDSEAQFEIVITPNPALPPGYFQTDARISVVAPTGEQVLGVTLPIAGNMQPEIRLLPARLLLPERPIGTVSEAVVTLQTLPDSRVVVDHIETESPGLRVEPTAIDGIPAGHCFLVRQQVMGEGDRTSAARFIIRKPDQKLIALPLEVCYRGESTQKARSTTVEEKQP